MSESLHLSESKASYTVRKPINRVENEPSPSLSSPIDRYLYLQSIVGNQTMQGLVSSGMLQAKLKIRQPNDIYEQEADRVADQVVPKVGIRDFSDSKSSLKLQRKPFCLECGEEKELIQPKPMTTRFSPLFQRQVDMKKKKNIVKVDAGTVNSNFTNRVERIKHGGEPMPASTRNFFENRFGQDFKNIRIHTDQEAGHLSSDLNARAFTMGNHIAFAPGQYSPYNRQGQWLLAHELTHTLQQSHDSTVIQGDFLGDLSKEAGQFIEDPLGTLRQGANTAYSMAASGFSNLGDLLGIPKLSGEGPELLLQILSLLNHPLVQSLPGFIFPGPTISTLQGFSSLLQTAWDIYKDPEKYIEAIKSSLAGMIDSAGGLAKIMATSYALGGYFDCVMRHLEPKIQYMLANWWQVLKDMAWEMIWPWPGVIEDFEVIWDKIKSMGSNIWDLEFNRAADDALSILRHLNAAAGRLYGWFLIGSVLVGTIAGAVGGEGIGALPGAAAGLAFAADVGMVLLATTISIEGSSMLKAAYNLTRDDRSEEEKECDCELIAASALTVGISLAMAILGGLAGRLAKNLIQRFGRKTWRLPARRPRGRQAQRTRRMARRRGERVGRNRESRGDVLEGRFSLAEQVRNLFNRRRVTVTDALSTADNFPGLDLTVDSRITVRSRTTGRILRDINAFDDAIAAGERVEITIDGGNIYQVKSHTSTSNLISTINREINSLANFSGKPTSRHPVILRNPSQRILVVFLEEPLPASDLAQLTTNASQRGVRLQVTTDPFPPGHPAIIPPDALPAIFSELGAEGARAIIEGETGESHEPSAGTGERFVECKL